MSLLTKVCQGIFSVPAHLTSLFCAQKEGPTTQSLTEEAIFNFQLNFDKLRKVSVLTEKALFNGNTEIHMLWIIFFLISPKMQRMLKGLCRNLSRTPFAYGHFWLFHWHITWSLLCNKFLVSQKEVEELFPCDYFQEYFQSQPDDTIGIFI